MLISLAITSVHGEEITQPALKIETISLWTDEELGSTEADNTEVWKERGENNDSVTQINRPNLTVYHPADPATSQTAIVICPG